MGGLIVDLILFFCQLKMPLLAIGAAETRLRNFTVIVCWFLTNHTQPILTSDLSDSDNHFSNILVHQIEEVLMVDKSSLNLLVDLFVPYGQRVDRPELLL